MKTKKLAKLIFVILILLAGSYLGYRFLPERTELSDRSLAEIKERGFIKVASSLSEYPWGGFDPSTGQATGGEAEIARLVARELGLETEFINSNDPAASVKDGTADAAFYKYLQAGDGTRLSDGYFATGLTLAVRVNNPSRGLSELRGKKIAYVESICCPGAPELIEKAAATPIKYDTTKTALEDIEAQKIDGGLVEMSETAWYVRHHPLLKLIDGDADHFLTSGRSFAAIIKNDKTALVEEMNKAIERVRDRNEFKDIIDRWYLFKI